MERITKEQMSEYLEKSQLYQRLSQGIIDVNVEMSHGYGRELNCITLRAWEIDADGHLVQDKKDNFKYLSVKMATWQTKRQNDGALLKMKNYLTKHGVEL